MRTGRSVIGFMASAVVVVLVAASCATSPDPIASDSPTDDPPVEPIECQVAQAPVAADGPPADGEMGPGDQGPGRWRVCMTLPTLATVEGSAWCTWDRDRQVVTEISGLPTPAGTVDYDAWLTAAGSFELHLTDRGQGGLIANYETAPGDLRVSTVPTWRSGTAAFEGRLVADPESGPPRGAPPVVDGTVTWVCGDAPAAS
ncbi:MAG: hypothetical protein WEC14_11100 [Chloroflexota bacterium]